MRKSLLLVGLLLALGISAAQAASTRTAESPIVRLGIKHIGHGSKTAKTGPLVLHSSATQGVISPSPAVYLVFWGSQWAGGGDPAGAAPALQTFFANLYGSADTWGTILSQYCEGLPAGTTSCNGLGTPVVHPATSLLPAGHVWFDNSAAAPAKATTGQIAAEATNAAAHFGNTSQVPNLNAQYVIASPSGTHPDGFPKTGFCGWHSKTNAGAAGTIAFTNLPYVPDLSVGACTTLTAPGPLDGYFSTETHEYAETVTDFWPSSGWLSSGGLEIGDLCESLDNTLTLAGTRFDVQGLWSNSTGKCVTSSP